MNARSDPTVVVEVDRREVTIAESYGLLVGHPARDELLFWGPGRFVPRVTKEMTSCIVTKHTREDLVETGRVEYPDASDDERIVVELVDSPLQDGTRHTPDPTLYDTRWVPDDDLSRLLGVVVIEAQNENWGNVRTTLDTALTRAERLACDASGGGE